MAFDLDRLLRPLKTRIANLVSRAVVQLVDDSQRMQLLQLGVLDDESREDVERFQNYGFTSVPRDGAEAVVLFVGGKREHGLAIAVDDRRYRITNLNPGEVAVYSDAGSSVVFKASGNIEITAAGAANVVLNGGVLNVARDGDTAGPYPIIATGNRVKM